ncbi:hypothetical protein MHAE_11811 [Mycobacterium haemophilum DSM 44634]
MNALFTTAMTLREVDAGVYEGELNQYWTIGPKVHGGAMLALCANAARTACGGESSGLQPALQPVAVSASFLWAPDPGLMRLTTSIRKRGRRISVVDVELTQDDRTAVHVVVNLGEPEHWVAGDSGANAAAPLLSANPVVDLMAPEPPDDIAPIQPGHPMAGLVHLGEGCDVRPVLSTLAPARAGRPPVIQMWARPRGVAPDALFALMCGDLSAPVNIGRGPRRLGAYRRTYRLSSVLARRRLAAGDLHLPRDRAGLVRPGSHRRRPGWPHRGAVSPTGPGTSPTPACPVARLSRAVWDAFRHGKNRDHRWRQHW